MARPREPLVATSRIVFCEQEGDGVRFGALGQFVVQKLDIWDPKRPHKTQCNDGRVIGLPLLRAPNLEA